MKRRTDPPATKGTLLVVDDDGINVLVASGMLHHLGYACHSARNGAEALEMLAEHRYDAVFMDCYMPEMDGLAATIELRRREAGDRHTAVIAMSAGVTAAERKHCAECGMDEFAAKPVTLARLASLVDAWAPRPGLRAVGDDVVGREQFRQHRAV